MAIEIKELSYIYSQGTPYEKHALNGVNLTIEQGEFIGLIGHTGSGKSTLIQHLNALLKPTSGSVVIDGLSLFEEKTSKKAIRQQVGLVFQYPEHQLFELTVYKDVAFGPKNMGLEDDEIHERVIEALKKVGLEEEIYEKSPFELSGGQKRRVAIAGVLAMKPHILILDEPTAGLDPYGRDEILNEIKRMHLQENMTIILVSHSMEDIANYVERIIVMDGGSVILQGDKYTVFKEVELLERIGLGVPQVAKICNELAKKGFVFDQTITTLDEAVKALKPQLVKKQ
ncbi:energy-coupling factor transporter ATPase [Vallitaleaceae bacterium 9-2]